MSLHDEVLRLEHVLNDNTADFICVSNDEDVIGLEPVSQDITAESEKMPAENIEEELNDNRMKDCKSNVVENASFNIPDSTMKDSNDGMTQQLKEASPKKVHDLKMKDSGAQVDATVAKSWRSSSFQIRDTKTEVADSDRTCYRQRLEIYLSLIRIACLISIFILSMIMYMKADTTRLEDENRYEIDFPLNSGKSENIGNLDIQKIMHAAKCMSELESLGKSIFSKEDQVQFILGPPGPVSFSLRQGEKIIECSLDLYHASGSSFKEKYVCYFRDGEFGEEGAKWKKTGHGAMYKINYGEFELWLKKIIHKGRKLLNNSIKKWKLWKRMAF